MPHAKVEQIRDASRRLVRELGFMRGDLAETGLPPSSVHALLEIDMRGGITANEIAERLKLDKSSVSRLLRKLVDSGDIIETPDETDARSKQLSLTKTGQARVDGVHVFARRQVMLALDRLGAEQQERVADGLRIYAEALGVRATGKDAPVVTIAKGLRPGALGRCAEMHGRYYALAAGFGPEFEAIVAAGLAEFSARADKDGNGIWLAMRDGTIAGTVAIDGEDLGTGVAHLRWFIVDDSLRGLGVGKQLLAAAVDFCDRHGFRETQLWTFSGLDAARHLYEAHGFALVEEKPGRQWGREVREQRFARSRARPAG